MKRPLPVILWLALLSMTACDGNDRAQVAKGLTITAKAISVVQTTVIQANKDGLINDDDTKDILLMAIRVNQAGQDCVALIRTLEEIGPADRQTLVQVLKPAIAAVQRALDNELLGVKNPETKQKVRGVILAVQTALNSIMLVIAGG